QFLGKVFAGVVCVRENSSILDEVLGSWALLVLAKRNCDLNTLHRYVKPSKNSVEIKNSEAISIELTICLQESASAKLDVGD
uniref:Uncharacterized protein n=1 Tax=Oryza meridionalis TaxID=40149 RepID=A0A0E0EQF7_9ORYZ